MADAQQGRLFEQPARRRRAPARPARPGKEGGRAGRRRGRGSGGITEVREGVWRIDVEIPPDPITGKRRRAARQLVGTKADAELALAKLRIADHEGRLPRPGTEARTVAEALDAYLADVEAGVIELAPKTLVTSRSARATMCRVVLPDGRRFGSIPLSSLSWREIEDLYRVLRRDRQAATVRRLATVLARALDRARKHGLIDHNPARDAARPKLARRKPYSPPKEEVSDLLDQLRRVDAEIADAVVMVAATAMRMGELLGLQWAEVDLRRREVHVAWSISDGGPGVGVVRKPTKRADWRDVPLTSGAAVAFERQRARMEATYGMELTPACYVFPGWRGPELPYRPDNFGDRLAKARGSSPLTFLHLRHFAATTMLDAGEDYRTVADVLGNSETTLRLHYDGRTNVDMRRAVTALEL